MLNDALVQCNIGGRGRYEITSHSYSLRRSCGAGVTIAPALAEDTPAAHGITEPSIATSLPQNGDASGARKRLYDRGISYNLIYTNDVLGNMSGGIRRGTIDQGKLEAQLYIDLEKFAGWKDWTFYANAFGIYNTGRIRRDYVGGMNTIAAIEATPTVRLSELWVERWAGPFKFQNRPTRR